MRLLPVNWATATAYYMGFLLFTLIFKTSKSSKCCCQTCNQHPSHLSHYSRFKRSRGKIVNNVIGYKVNEESLAPQLTGTTASNTIKANKVKALKIKNPPDLTTSSRSY